MFVVVVDRDGASQSGLFCGVSYMVERLKVEQEVDVFQSVKHTRVNRHQLVPNLVSVTFRTLDWNTRVREIEFISVKYHYLPGIEGRTKIKY